MKLENILMISADLVCESGLHIGAGDAEMHIGGVDNTVVKNPVTNRPYIPGSSLKGKIRSLLEWRSGFVKQNPLSWQDYLDSQQSKEVLHILQLFGLGGSDRPKEEDCKALGPSRLSFWDCPLSENFEKDVAAGDAVPTEVKSENTINRLSGEAMPRQTERVPAGAVFDFRLGLKKISGDDEAVLLNTVFAGMKLLEMDSLGGGGSRGYGKVRFQNVKVSGKDYQKSFDECAPFKRSECHEISDKA